MSIHLMPRIGLLGHRRQSLIIWTTLETMPYAPLHACRRTPMHGGCRTFPAGHSFDTVICLNVVEHVQTTLAHCETSATFWTTSGRAIILVPNGPKLYGTLDEVLGHCRRYTEEQLDRSGRTKRIHGREGVEVQPAWSCGVVA